MKTLTNYKITQITNFNQLILMDYKGFVIHSCDSIFSTKLLKQSPLQNNIVFIESIFDSLAQLKPSDPEIRFTKVEMPAKFLPGYYDFTFSSVSFDNQNYILWSIFDYTDLYIDLKKYQQRKNELEICRQGFELKNKNLSSPKDILMRHNFFNEYFQKNTPKEFTTELQELLLSNENALDTFSIINLANKEQNILQGLSDVFSQLGKIKEEIDIFINEGTSKVSAHDAFQLKSVLEEIISLVNKELGLNAEIHYRLDNAIPNNIFGHVSSIKQILFNLLLVFLEQNPSSKIDIFISSTNKSENKCLLNFSVSTPEEIYQNNNKSINNPTGLILRISLIKKLLEMCKGQILPTDDLSSALININLQIPVKV